MSLIIEQFICGTDNFGILIHDAASGLTAAIDAPEAAPIAAKVNQKGWALDHILVTHHHRDHTQGIQPLKAAFGSKVTGPAAEADRIPGIDRTVSGGDTFAFGEVEVRVIATPGHTLGHIVYWLPGEGVVFLGDTLFSMGCGRIIKGTPEQMWASLEKLHALPDETAIYCGHEYTEANGRFALTVEPDNADLVARCADVKRLRAAGKATLPTTIGLEKRTNPFLRARDKALRAHLGMEHATPAQVFTEGRKRKDSFK